MGRPGGHRAPPPNGTLAECIPLPYPTCAIGCCCHGIGGERVGVVTGRQRWQKSLKIPLYPIDQSKLDLAIYGSDKLDTNLN
ncbi:hypothetical protein CRG98_013126 [Punica granatum]|uniref:Uncharacterized protein n=1 Tax=Punica granatum TaxID=22663 RepID=A0A2I0KDZ3_PUNGR|nr:hypothetical protein CRG98_013126 [Punica granatum]